MQMSLTALGIAPRWAQPPFLPALNGGVPRRNFDGSCTQVVCDIRKKSQSNCLRYSQSNRLRQVKVPSHLLASGANSPVLMHFPFVIPLSDECRGVEAPLLF